MEEDDGASEAFASEADELWCFGGVGRDVEDVERGSHVLVCGFVEGAGDFVDG